jgi:putative lipoprotein
VTYLQRIALPNNARVTVQIQDVSKADAPATILGEQVIPTNGKQVPFAFEVSYDPSKIVPAGRYNLYARITDGDGKLRFITDTATPVINNGPTENVALTLVQVP